MILLSRITGNSVVIHNPRDLNSGPSKCFNSLIHLSSPYSKFLTLRSHPCVQYPLKINDFNSNMY